MTPFYAALRQVPTIIWLRYRPNRLNLILAAPTRSSHSSSLYSALVLVIDVLWYHLFFIFHVHNQLGSLVAALELLLASGPEVQILVEGQKQEHPAEEEILEEDY